MTAWTRTGKTGWRRALRRTGSVLLAVAAVTLVPTARTEATEASAPTGGTRTAQLTGTFPRLTPPALQLWPGAGLAFLVLTAWLVLAGPVGLYAGAAC